MEVEGKPVQIHYDITRHVDSFTGKKNYKKGFQAHLNNKKTILFFYDTSSQAISNKLYELGIDKREIKHDYIRPAELHEIPRNELNDVMEILKPYLVEAPVSHKKPKEDRPKASPNFYKAWEAVLSAVKEDEARNWTTSSKEETIRLVKELIVLVKSE